MEHKHKEGMIDNRMVKDSHQEGIERVKQRKGDMEVGQGGKMGKVVKANWKRPNSASTPRKA
jgi:hypothetical protein